MKNPLFFLRRLVWAAFALACCAAAAADGDFVLDEPVQRQVRELITATDLPTGYGKVTREITVGALDARLRLAPCQKVQPYWPPAARPMGRTRVGLRCVEGPKAWNVSLPVEVRVMGTGWAATAAFPAGHVLAMGDVKHAPFDLAAEASPALGSADEAPIGRVLSRGLQPGEGVRESHLKVREWFAAGEVVQVKAVGTGFAIASAGEALNPGVEGRPIRVRLESGRIVTGRPVGERLVEITL